MSVRLFSYIGVVLMYMIKNIYVTAYKGYYISCVLI